jgi:hypothetical protein
MSEGQRSLLAVTAAANVGLHLVGLVFALFALRPGSPVVPLDQRVAYLGAHPLGWSLGWSIWILCAAAFVVWLFALHGCAESTRLAEFALKAAMGGAIIDVLCDLGQIVLLPDHARALFSLADMDSFLSWERRLSLGGLVVANGLYSLAALVATAAVRRQVPASALLLGVTTFVAGMGLAWAGAVEAPRLVELATALTFASFLPWTVLVTRAIADDRPT